MNNGEVMIGKERQGSEGSKEYIRIQQIAVCALPISFGVAKHKVTTFSGTSPASGNTQNTMRIQEKITGILACAKDGNR